MENKLKDPITTLNENQPEYYTEMYSAGEVKEQLAIGQEVADKNIRSGTIDTSDATLTKVDNVFRLSVADPDGKIFSMTIDGQSKTFYIGFFGNTALAYSTLETELQTWLGVEYVVEYDTGTFFNLSRVDGQAITYSDPNLVRNIAFSGWNEHAKIDVIIDGVTYSPPSSGNTGTLLSWFVTQLTGSTYYVTSDNPNLIIARKDGAIPTISKTQYNRYTYEMNYNDEDTPNSGQFPDNTITTIDGIQEYTSHLPASRRFNGDWIIRNLLGAGTYTSTVGSIGTASGATTIFKGVSFKTKTRVTISKITKISSCTATRAVIRDATGTTTLATANFSGNDATLSYTLDANTTYIIGADSNGASYTEQYYLSNATIDDSFATWTITSGTSANIISVELSPTDSLTGYTKSALFRNSGSGDTVWTEANKTQYFNKQHTLYFRKIDYSISTVSSDTTYTLPGSFPNNTGVGYSLVQINNLADITVTTYTEISKTFTLLSNNFYIPTYNLPNKIKITAISSGGTSEGEYKLRNQSATARYGTTVETVQDLIFKTDASNYGNIVLIKRGGFVITWTTNTSNILNWTCE